MKKSTKRKLENIFLFIVMMIMAGYIAAFFIALGKAWGG